MEYQETRAVLVGICTDDGKIEDVEKSLCELERLLDTAGGVAFAKMIQNKDKPDPRTLIGSGKVRELAAICQGNDIELVVFDEELAPSQIRNLEDELGEDVRVIQTYINRIGRIDPEIPEIAVDGIFGQQTKEAVMAIQKQLGVEQNGAIGPVEWVEIITRGNNI